MVGCRKRTAIVRCSGPRSGTWIAFKGRHTATIVWPAFSVGVGLTFKATILSGTRTLLLGAPVRSRAAALGAFPPGREVVALAEAFDDLVRNEIPCGALEVDAVVRAHLHELPGLVLDVLRVAAVVTREEEVRVEVADAALPLGRLGLRDRVDHVEAQRLVCVARDRQADPDEVRRRSA